MEILDETLVELTLQGGKDAFSQLVRRYQGAIYAYLYHLVGDYTQAEDLAQETFIEAYTHLSQLKEKKRFAAWVRGIANNLAMNWIRRQGREPLHVTSDLYVQSVADETRSDIAARRELQDAIEEAIWRLPEKYRLIVIMRYLQDMSYRQIASFLGVPASTVRGVLYRGNRLLRNYLHRFRDERGEQWHHVSK